jgi:hypothetical protein
LARKCAEPPQKTVNFKDDEIRIYFDEYIKLEKLRDQLVISPPLDQSAYVISPQGMAAKYINVAFMDTLTPNTTYTFNFGESVVDNNEGNPLSFFSYVFSTDSLKFTLKHDTLTKSYAYRREYLCRRRVWRNFHGLLAAL